MIGYASLVKKGLGGLKLSKVRLGYVILSCSARLIPVRLAKVRFGLVYTIITS